MEWQPCQPYRTVEMATTSSEPLTLLRHVKNVFRISEVLFKVAGYTFCALSNIVMLKYVVVSNKKLHIRKISIFI